MIRSNSATYESEYLFTIRERKERKLLLEEQAQHFHHTVAQLLFMCMLDRPYIQPINYFLTTRVRFPDKDDWGKLKRGLKYLKGTLYMKLYLRDNSLNILCRWVDALYGTQWDFKGHTGAVMLIGVGAIMSFSRK